MRDRRLGEFAGSSAGGVELAQQRRQVDAHRVLHRRWLVQVGVGEDLPQTCGVAVEIAFATGLDQQSAPPGGVSFAAWAGVGAAARMVRASRRANPPSGSSANVANAAG